MNGESAEALMKLSGLPAEEKESLCGELDEIAAFMDRICNYQTGGGETEQRGETEYGGLRRDCEARGTAIRETEKEKMSGGYFTVARVI